MKSIFHQQKRINGSVSLMIGNNIENCFLLFPNNLVLCPKSIIIVILLDNSFAVPTISINGESISEKGTPFIDCEKELKLNRNAMM